MEFSQICKGYRVGDLEYILYDAQALIDTAEGAMQEIETILQRIRELSIQAANDTNSADDRTNVNAEAQSLLTEIDRISSSTTWAGQSLLDGTFTDTAPSKKQQPSQK